MTEGTVLALGIGEVQRKEINEAVPGVVLLESPYRLEELTEPLAPLPVLILCGLPEPPVSVTEVAQLLRGVYMNTPVYLVIAPGQKADRPSLIKNGFTDVFFTPIDRERFSKAAAEALGSSGHESRRYRKIKLIDVVPDTVLDFDTFLFLPANRKHVPFSRAGDPIDAERASRLKAHAVSSLSVKAAEVKNFYAYTARMLKATEANAALGATERAERMEAHVRNILTGLFSDASTSTESGKQTISDLQGIVRDYLKQGNSNSGALYNRILSAMAQGEDAYSHAVNVSTFGALFAIGLNAGCAEEVAIAGVLHDMGLVSVPAAVLKTPPESWLPVDREIYQTHPEKSLELIRDRRLVVAEEVHKIILQHHERYGGGGFPKGIAGSRICIGAQILAIADEFDERTVPVEGRPALRPLEAIAAMVREAESNPSVARHDAILLKRVADLMKEPA